MISFMNPLVRRENLFNIQKLLTTWQVPMFARAEFVECQTRWRVPLLQMRKEMFSKILQMEAASLGLRHGHVGPGRVLIN
jgi:hypothetical protein